MDPQEASGASRRRILHLAIAFLAGLLVLLGGLWRVQVASFEEYERYRRVQSTRTVGEAGVRGRILDRNGEVLAESRPEYGVALYLEEMRPRFQETYRRMRRQGGHRSGDLRELQLLCRYLAASNVCHQVRSVLGREGALDRGALRAPLPAAALRPLPPGGGALRGGAGRFAEQGGRIAGVDLAAGLRRSYPRGSLAAHVLGYVRPEEPRPLERGVPLDYCHPDWTGRRGVEKSQDSLLRGRPGIRTVRIDNLMYRQEDRLWLPTEPGHDVTLTLDVRIQEAAEELLALHPEGTEAAVVAMDVRNGDVLALASVPSFDPNEFAGRLSVERLAELQDPARLPLVCRATQGIYPPGSIFKLATALAILEEGGVDPREIHRSPGHIRVGGRLIDDEAPPGAYGFVRALACSSNSYFVHHALEAGPGALARWGRALFLGRRTGMVAAEEEQPGSFPGPGRLASGWHPGDTANLAIGQGEIAVTPLQMAAMAAAVANGGVVWRPRIVAGYRPSPGAFPGAPFRAFPRGVERGRLPIRPRTLEVLHRAMLENVEGEEGTGRRARLAGLPIAGKTGTAQTGRRDGEREILDAWFVSFAPADAPRYAVATLVADGVSGGSSCAPISREIHRLLHNLDPGEAPG